jgi:hypothetical protein
MANGGGSFADGVVNSALRFRAQAPLVDQLLREIGIEGGDIQRLVGGASGATPRCRRPRRRPKSDMDPRARFDRWARSNR